MKKYIFVLGRNPGLSYAELISYFKNFGIKYKLEYYKEKIAVFLLNTEVDISRLGGTVKIAEVISEEKVGNVDFYVGSKNKVNYAISVYNNKKLLKEFESSLRGWFKSQKIKVMRKRPKETDFSPKELRDVLEFVVCDKYIGRTVYVSNPTEFKKRDRERKHNDFMRSMSIRLAKILINLSYAKTGKILLDPFCGIGVLLEESVFQGVECVGVEIDGETRKKALDNLNSISKVKVRIINGNSSKINKYFKREIDSVASEPYLGPYFRKYPKKEEAIKVVKELNELYSDFFVGLRKVLKENGRVAIILPIIRASNRKNYRLNVESFLKKSGFKLAKLDGIEFPLSFKEGKGIIEREIYVLE